MTIRPFRTTYISQALQLWSMTEGLGLTVSDNEDAIRTFLDRNPGFSAVATDQAGTVIGAVLCGHNARAGFLYHLAVARSCRRSGVGTSLVQFCLSKLAELDIPHCNIFVYTANELGNQFWLRHGWKDPKTWKVMQRRVDLGAPAERKADILSLSSEPAAPSLPAAAVR
jgi:ribosomal protein S18 acetylase RimI-like enzyme